MNKEINIVKEIIDSSDLVIELVDARFFYDSRLYDLEREIINKGKFLLVAINKIDLIDKKDYFKLKRIIKKLKSEREEIHFDFISVKNRIGIARLRSDIKKLAKIIQRRWRKEGKKFNKIRCCIIGLPNIGKSSLINILRGKHIARTSVKPGFTKGYQYIKLTKNILLIDTPGIYLPKISDKHLVFLNALDLDKVEDIENAAHFVYNLIKDRAKVEIKKVYGFNNSESFFSNLAKEKKYFLKEKELDLVRAYKKFLHDWYNGKIKVCFLNPILKKEAEEKKDHMVERNYLILDTNFLIYYVKDGNIEYIEELFNTYSCIIIDKTLKEIKKLVKGKYKQRIVLLLEFLEEKIKEGKIKIENTLSHEDVDSAILRLIKEKNIYAVATYDRELIRKIKKINPKTKILY